MKFDARRFEKNLQKWTEHNQTNREDKILYYLLHLIQNEKPVSEIDFDTFTLADVDLLNKAIRRLDFSDGKKDTSSNFQNPVHEVLGRASIFPTLLNPDYRVFIPTDDFI